MRLSTRSLAGMARTLVAVGTVRLTAMFAAVRAAAPRSRTCVASAVAGAAGGAGAPGAWATPDGAGGPGRAGTGGAGAGAAPDPGGAAAAGVAATVAAGAAVAGKGDGGARGGSTGSGGESAKKFHQALSTDPGSARYRWYSSSTSHSLGPKSVPAAVDCGWLTCPAWPSSRSGAAPGRRAPSGREGADCSGAPDLSSACAMRSAEVRGDSEDTADIALFRSWIICRFPHQATRRRVQRLTPVRHHVRGRSRGALRLRDDPCRAARAS